MLKQVEKSLKRYRSTVIVQTATSKRRADETVVTETQELKIAALSLQRLSEDRLRHFSMR